MKKFTIIIVLFLFLMSIVLRFFSISFETYETIATILGLSIITWFGLGTYQLAKLIITKIKLN